MRMLSGSILILAAAILNVGPNAMPSNGTFLSVIGCGFLVWGAITERPTSAGGRPGNSTGRAESES